MTIIELQYFPPIAFWAIWLKQGHITFEAQENYQKGSYRNRCHIASSTGIQSLSIPLLKGKNQKTPIQNVLIDNSMPWQRDHWRTLRTAYGKSPFFEHYVDELAPIFHRPFTTLFECNTTIINRLADILDWDLPFDFSEAYHRQEGHSLDYRHRIRPNRPLPFSLVSYPQVFMGKTGFLENLSVLDLLFCMGPESQIYMETKLVQG